MQVFSSSFSSKGQHESRRWESSCPEHRRNSTWDLQGKDRTFTTLMSEALSCFQFLVLSRLASPCLLFSRLASSLLFFSPLPSSCLVSWIFWKDSGIFVAVLLSLSIDSHFQYYFEIEQNIDRRKSRKVLCWCKTDSKIFNHNLLSFLSLLYRQLHKRNCMWLQQYIEYSLSDLLLFSSSRRINEVCHCHFYHNLSCFSFIITFSLLSFTQTSDLKVNVISYLYHLSS